MSLAPYLLMTKSPEQVLEAFRFQINTTNNPDFLMPSQQGVLDVVRVSAGLFDIFFATKYPELISCTGAVQVAAVGAGTVGALFTVVSYTPATGVLRVRIVDQDGAPAAADPADNDWVHVQAVFCRRNKLCQVGAI